MKKDFTVSLVVTTYNNEPALSLYLHSALQQSVLPDEILVADDGSGDATRLLVHSFMQESPVPIRHIWHEDKGFRLTTIRNKAIAAARGEYIIQTDGDLILHRDFVKDHRAAARCGCFVGRGSRVMLDGELTAALLAAPAALPKISIWMRGVRHRLNGMRIPCLCLFFQKFQTRRGRGCNMAFWRKDLLAVNGYDESMVGWGHEDLELAARLRHNGVRPMMLKFGGIVYHLYHKNASRSGENANLAILSKTEQEKKKRCEQGVSQYL